VSIDAFVAGRSWRSALLFRHEHPPGASKQAAFHGRCGGLRPLAM
jgi:hypothetical protein